MTDYFALLDEPRRPWLDAAALKQKFLTRSAEVHPDRVHGGSDKDRRLANQRYTDLNSAYVCLREPRDRLRHLLELELGRKPTDLHEVPSELADLYMEVAAVCREADRFLTRQAKVTSPLLRAQSFPEAQDWTGRLAALQRSSNSQHEKLLGHLRELDAGWVERAAESPARSSLLAELETLGRRLGFVSRWNAQIQERLVRLMP